MNTRLYTSLSRNNNNNKLKNLILVRRRNEIQQQEIRYNKNLPEENHEAKNDINNNDTNNNGAVDEQADELTEDDKELERFFQVQIEAMDQCSLLQSKQHEKLPKMRLTKEKEGSARIGFLADI